MLNSKINVLMPTLDIMHIYFQSPNLTSLQSCTKQFKSFTSESIDKLIKAKKLSCDILFIELPLLDKQSVISLNAIVKKYRESDIYIFAKEPEKPFILKFALHFELSKVLPLEDDLVFLEKTLFDASNKIRHKLEERQQVEVTKQVNSLFAFLVFKEQALVFANEKAKNIFEADKLQELENIVRSNENIYTLLSTNKEGNHQIILENSQKERWKYTLFLNAFGKKDERLLSIVPNQIINTEEAFLGTSNRFKFIEELKDKLAQNTTSNNNISLLMVNISNFKKLLDACSSIKVHNFIKKFITKLSYHKENYQDLVQWDSHFFIILIENSDFEDLKLSLDALHQKLIYSEIDEEISPIINSSLLRIDTLGINEIIEYIDKIKDHVFTYNDFAENEFFEIHHLNDYEDEQEQIHHYLTTCIGNKTPIKLLNIYKGLCINTKSNIIKANPDKSYLVHAESLQGYSMQFENRTVIQSPDLPRDILASVIHVNIENSQALINDLNFLEASANNREHTRVQPSFRTPIHMKYKKSSYNGEMIDLSTHAIAIKFNHSLSNQLSGENIELNFKLPDENSDLGYFPMYVIGKVVHVAELSLTKTKVVVMMEFEKPYDSYILQYMYKRQKELIIELKKVNKLNSKKKAKAI